MSNYVLFQMWGPFRQSLMKGHLFYVDQARKRVLSQFDNLEAEADRAAEEWLEQSSGRFDADRHDPGDFYEAANDAGIEFYQLLSDMRDQTQLSIIAGMFHEWDKQLRDWLVREMQHWHRGDTAFSKVWSVDFGKIVDLLQSFGWKIRDTDYFATLDACRLVVNVYKHGAGKSLEDLKRSYPQYFDDPFRGSGGRFSGTNFLDHTHLKVTKEQFQAFSDAIVAFWRDVPESVVGAQIVEVPDWFGKSIQADRGGED
ncbi:hypothetical protein EJC49_09745 [Aquibium carbonis]|jgi:hypothetical protein|uniref:Uncharacterized protein n=1 Tax=Aquibium carbonis TaxID=2495581 RepID=A0A429YYK7_9HYPH|nr:hypothetical protein [Aquibium carbonis]RST86555.1 hypothetical protein EJC49_09745 [Aquibium carbonis]